MGTRCCELSAPHSPYTLEWDTGKHGIKEEGNNGITFNCQTLNFADAAGAIDTSSNPITLPLLGVVEEL